MLSVYSASKQKNQSSYVIELCQQAEELKLKLIALPPGRKFRVHVSHYSASKQKIQSSYGTLLCRKDSKCGFGCDFDFGRRTAKSL